MSDVEVFDIWPPETGIADLPPDFVELAVAETARIRAEWQQRKADLGASDRIHEFSERLNREWSIETGIIENLYFIERGVTQTLIEQGFKTALLVHGSIDKDPEFIKSILEDQQSALESLFAFVKQDQPLTVGYIKELHAMMTRSQGSVEAFNPKGEKVDIPLIKGDWKKEPNFPSRDGVQYRFCPPNQTASEMEKLINLHHEHSHTGVPSEVEAAWLHHRFTQIHPFQDGNGRVARALASMVLIRDELFPMVVPREEKSIYLQSLEKADEGNLKSLVLLISRRQEVAFHQALSVFDKLSPQGESLVDEASKLGSIYARQRDVVLPRLEKRIEELHGWVYGELTRQASQTTAEIRKSAGIQDMSGGGFGGGLGGNGSRFDPGIEVLGASAKDKYLPEAQAVFVDRWSVVPGRPCDAFEVVVRIGPEFKLVVHLHSTHADTNETVQIAAMSIDKIGPRALDVGPLTWEAQEGPSEIQQRLPAWIKEFLKVGLAQIRRQL